MQGPVLFVAASIGVGVDGECRFSFDDVLLTDDDQLVAVLQGPGVGGCVRTPEPAVEMWSVWVLEAQADVPPVRFVGVGATSLDGRSVSLLRPPLLFDAESSASSETEPLEVEVVSTTDEILWTTYGSLVSFPGQEELERMRSEREELFGLWPDPPQVGAEHGALFVGVLPLLGCADDVVELGLSAEGVLYLTTGAAVESVARDCGSSTAWEIGLRLPTEVLDHPGLALQVDTAPARQVLRVPEAGCIDLVPNACADGPPEDEEIPALLDRRERDRTSHSDGA